MSTDLPRLTDDYRDERGRMLPGNPGGPGRPPKAKELAIINAAVAAFSPDEITDYLQQAMDLAIAQRSPRGIMSVLTFVRDTAVGKPISMRVQSDSRIDMLGVIERLAADMREGGVTVEPRAE